MSKTKQQLVSAFNEGYQSAEKNEWYFNPWHKKYAKGQHAEFRKGYHAALHKKLNKDKMFLYTIAKTNVKDREEGHLELTHTRKYIGMSEREMLAFIEKAKGIVDDELSAVRI